MKHISVILTAIFLFASRVLSQTTDILPSDNLVVSVITAPPVRAQETEQTDLRQKKIVFNSERDGHGEIYVMDSDGSNQQRLTFTISEFNHRRI